MASVFSEEAIKREELRVEREKKREERALQLRDTKSRVKKYDRLKKRNRTHLVEDKKLKSFLQSSDQAAEHAAIKAARSELLLQEEPGFLVAEGLEKTSKFKQAEIAGAVPLASSCQYFDLRLDKLGPYSINYSRNGRQLLIGGYKGHLATFDWREKRLSAEFHVHQTVRDVQYLHNEMMFAVAQKRFVYIYDDTGMELHCLKQMREVHRLNFLPYHFLLVSADDHGGLCYLDTSVGRAITTRKTGMGPLHCMTHNPYNAIVHLGHSNGTVSLWSPNSHTTLVKMLCHRGPLTDLAVDQGGWAMVTVGMDSYMKVWDIRSTYRELTSVHLDRPAVSVSVSQRGLVSVGAGRVVKVWQDLISKGVGHSGQLYLTHRGNGDINTVAFSPFEDCLGIGHAYGFTSILVPGAGEANFDALEVNPFHTKKQRQEGEVKQLLEKIPAELISLDPTIITKVQQAPRMEGEEEEENEKGEGREIVREKRKTRGKGVLSKKLQKKNTSISDKEKEERRKQLQKNKKVEPEEPEATLAAKTRHVLDRFR